MNLRILKKLSKRAAPLLKAIGDECPQFSAKRGEDYTSSSGHDRKHWERGNARNPIDFHGYRYWQARSGLGNPYMKQPDHPLKGTVMLSWSTGYYEVEWEHDDAWTLLQRAVSEHWMDYVEVEGTEDESGCPEMKWVCHRRFRNPSQILRSVPDVVAIIERQKAERSARLVSMGIQP